MSTDRILDFHRKCKEITVLHKGGPIKRLLAGCAAHFSGWRLFLHYYICPPALPSPLPEDAGFIVSLTSFPPRIKHLWIVIDTLMRQSCRPAAINLVLCSKEFPGKKIPARLERYLPLGLRIIWVEENLKPHKKYYYSFQEEIGGKKRCVITVDDDVFYPSDTLERLLRMHAASPEAVCANYVMKNSDGRCSDWTHVYQPVRAGFGYTPIGFGGILYPYSYYSRDFILDKESFMKICPGTDDLWMRYCEEKSGTPISTGDFFAHPPSIPSSGRRSLARDNVRRGNNDKVWEILSALKQ